jgi:curved DNA-binding protein CbpA
MASMEYVQSAKRAGIYSYLLNYISTVQNGGNPPGLPGEGGQPIKESQPRSQQTHIHNIAATHPSLIGSEKAKQQLQQIAIRQEVPSWKIVTETPKQKAISYFSSCLEVLNIQEEVALTDESLKTAYKKMAKISHPDRGGSSEYFEAVTRAYAYLTEILSVMQRGKRKAEASVHTGAADHLRGTREEEAKQWEHAEPVRLNAKNLDMNAFNKLFEESHMPDPDADGYGDWLKSSDGGSAGPKFSEKFNRDVFNRMFDEETRKSKQPSNQLVHPGEMALTLNANSGTDLLGTRPDTYTAAPNSRFQFTDLRGAYTTDNTVTDKVANVTVGERSFDQYRASREKAPEALSSQEMQGIRAFESRQHQMDSMRERKMAEMSVRNQNYHDMMKQRVITDAVDLNTKRLGY